MHGFTDQKNNNNAWLKILFHFMEMGRRMFISTIHIKQNSHCSTILVKISHYIV